LLALSESLFYANYGDKPLIFKNKLFIRQVFVAACLALLPGCALRTFTVTSDPTGAKVFYVNRADRDFRGYTPINVSDNAPNIGPDTKIILEKEGYKSKSVNVSGFPGDEVSLFVELEKEGVDPDAAMAAEFTPEEYTNDARFPKDQNALDAQADSKAKEPAVAPTPTPTKESDTIKIDTGSPTVPVEEDASIVGDAVTKLAENPSHELSSLNAQTQTELTTLQKRLEEMELKLNEMKENKQTKDAKEKESAEIEIKNRAVSNLLTAQKYIQLKKYNEALLETFKSISFDPKFAHAYALQGSVYFLLKDYKSALSSWEKALELDPSNHEVLRVHDQVKNRYMGLN